MTTTDPRPRDQAAPTVLTATVRQTARRLAFWIAVAVVLVLLALGSLAVVGAAGELPRLSAESAAPDGGRAVAEVLREQGVEVTPTDTLEATVSAVDDGSDATLLVYDEVGNLSDDAQERLLDLDVDLVLLDPSSGLLEAAAPAVRQAGTPDDDPLEPACSLPAAVAADSVSPGGASYRVVETDTDTGTGTDTDTGTDAAAAETETCLRSDSPDAEDAFSLVRVTDDQAAITVVGATDALTNGSVLELDNAAFALTLLGERERLIWYLPSLADSLEPGDDISALTPGWLTPSIVLLVLVVVAAAVWRGRRLGPLIVENLPVVVRSNETMEGRARLYQRSSARLRALDALRLGAITRLARVCGLPASATVDDVVLSLAQLLGRPVRDIRSLLVDDDPGTDADLIRLSDALLDLEAAAAIAARP